MLKTFIIISISSLFVTSSFGQSFQTDSIYQDIGLSIKAVRQFDITESSMTREFGGNVTYFKRTSEIKEVKIGKYRFDRWNAYDETHNRKCKVYFKEGFSIALKYPGYRLVEYTIKP